MDTISALIPSIKSENLPLPTPTPTPTPCPSESNLTAITHTPTVNISPPTFANSINELRSLSTSLSTFLSRYDELNTHLNYIKLSIDYKLPSKFFDDAVNPNQSPLSRLIESSCDGNVNVVTERNPNGTVCDCERSREYVSAHGRPSYLKEDGEIDSLNMLEEIDCLHKHDDVDVLKDCDEIDVSNKLLETDILKIDEKIDISKNFGEIYVSNKLLETNTLKIGEETIVSTKILETDTDVLMDSEGIDVSKKLLEADTDVLMDSEGIDVSRTLVETDTDVLEDSEAIDVLKNSEEVDVLKKHEEADVSKNSEEIDVSKKFLETDTVKIDEETDVSKMDEETDVSKKHEEINILMKHEEISKDYEETDILMNREEIDTSMNYEEIEISINREEIDTLNQHEETDLCIDHEEIDTSNKHEEIDTLKKLEENNVSRKPGSSNSPKKQEEETDILKNHEEIDTLKKHEDIDVSRKPESRNSPKKHEETDLSKKHEEFDISKNPVEIDMEENDVSKKHEETNDSKKLEEFDISKKHEEIDNSKPEEIDVCKKHEETDNLKKLEDFDISKKHEEIDVSKKLEEIGVSKKHVEIDTLKKSADSELETICARMDAKGMKKYVITHITDMNKLREELPKALKLAKDPAKLVLDSIGRFFLQTSKAYHNGKNHHEHIVSRLASVMILECFVMISSDGIEISKEDKAYAAEAAVRWKQRMIKEGGVRHMEEADARGLLLLISGFGIRDRDFKIEAIRDLIMASYVKGISTTLRRSIILIPKVPEVIDMMVKNNLEIEAADTAYTFGLEDKCHPQIILTRFLYNKIKDIQKGSPFQVLTAMKQQLFDLKSVKQCLESHKVETSNLFPDFKINEKIQHLEKEINNRNLTLKRKSTEPESLENPIHHEAKRPCFSHENMPHGQKPIGHYPMNPYTWPAEPRCSYFDFDRGLSGSYDTHVYGGTVAGQMSHTANVRPYGWHEDPPYIDKYMGQPYSRQSQTYDSQPYGRSPVESFPGFPARWSPSSDLYSFADTVVEQESRGSHKAGNGTSRSSYMY